MGLRHREDIAVGLPLDGDYEVGELRDAIEHDGVEYAEVRVWNFLNVEPAYQFRGGNPTMETYPSETRIKQGGGGKTPSFITEWVAEELWHELGMDTLDETHGIQVVDVEADEVLLL